MIAPRALAILILVGPSAAIAEEPRTWRACAMDFVRNTLDLGNLRLEVPPEKLGPNAHLMARIIAKDGIANAGLQVHAAYAACTEPLVTRGIPVEPSEKRAADCAAGAIMRLGTLHRLKQADVTLEDLKQGVPPEAHDVVAVLYGTTKDFSFTKAVWASLEGGLTCIEAARSQQDQ